MKDKKRYINLLLFTYARAGAISYLKILGIPVYQKIGDIIKLLFWVVKGKKITSNNNLKIDIELEDIKLVKNLVKLLEKYIDDLPQELKSSLYQISATGINDFTVDDLHSTYPDFDSSKCQCSENKVISVNQILKKVVVFDNGEKTLYPLNFYLKYDDKVIIEWRNND